MPVNGGAKWIEHLNQEQYAKPVFVKNRITHRFGGSPIFSAVIAFSCPLLSLVCFVKNSSLDGWDIEYSDGGVTVDVGQEGSFVGVILRIDTAFRA